MDIKHAEDIKNQIEKILQKVPFEHIDSQRLICFRSFGSKSRANARIWALPRIWQMALSVKPHYVIEILSERFDKMNSDDKTRVLIHELLHIPKTFSGALRPHKSRCHRINRSTVEKWFKKYREYL